MNARKIILDAYRDWSRRPFDWNGACCLAWCGDVARRITGADPTTALRARYTTERGCNRGMIEEGWRTRGDAAASLWSEIPPAQARSGDVAMVSHDGEEGLGVVCGDMIAVRTANGMGQVPLGAAVRAFRVG